MTEHGHGAASFELRWLLHSGLPEARLAQAAERAEERARRYPWLVRVGRGLVLWAIEWLSALLFLGSLTRACRLEPGAFERLLQKLHGNSNPMIRLPAVLVLAPLMEALTEEAPPERPEHPLSPRLGEASRALVPTTELDVLIIGSGAGGAPVAWELAGRGLKVGILEMGALAEPDAAPRVVEQHYVSQGMVGSIEGGPLLVMAGSTVGGTTSINSGTCLRPLEERLAVWDERWGTSFAGGALDPWLDLAEERIGVVVPPKELLSVSAALVEKGLEALGRPGAYVLPRNAPRCEGSGRCAFVCPKGAKRSTDWAFLPEALDRGARLFAPARATGIAELPDRVEVVVELPEGKRTLTAKRLIIAAGGLYTPGLIRRNRLGNRWRQAGRSLKVHPATKVFAHFPDVHHGERGVPQGLGYRPPDLPRVSMEGIHTPRSIVSPMFSVAGERLRWWLERIDNLASFGFFVRDLSTGVVREIGDEVLIRYRMHPDNIKDMGAGVLLTAEIFLAAGAERVLLPIVAPFNEIRSKEELAKLSPEMFDAKRLLPSGFHPQGTAGIGRVVDPDLRLLGSERIFVCDASVLPDSPGVNPQVTIMALSLRLAEHLATGRS